MSSSAKWILQSKCWWPCSDPKPSRGFRRWETQNNRFFEKGTAVANQIERCPWVLWLIRSLLLYVFFLKNRFRYDICSNWTHAIFFCPWIPSILLYIISLKVFLLIFAVNHFIFLNSLYLRWPCYPTRARTVLILNSLSHYQAICPEFWNRKYCLWMCLSS